MRIQMAFWGDLLLLLALFVEKGAGAESASSAAVSRLRRAFPFPASGISPSKSSPFMFRTKLWGPYTALTSESPTEPGGAAPLEYHRVHSFTDPKHAPTGGAWVRDLYQMPGRKYGAANPMPAAVLPNSIGPYAVPRPELPLLAAAPAQPFASPLLWALQRSQNRYRAEFERRVQRQYDQPSRYYAWSAAAGTGAAPPVSDASEQ